MTLIPIVKGPCDWRGDRLLFLLLDTPGRRAGSHIWEVRVAVNGTYVGRIAYSALYSEYVLHSDCGDRCYSAAEMKEIVEFCEAQTKEFSERKWMKEIVEFCEARTKEFSERNRT